MLEPFDYKEMQDDRNRWFERAQAHEATIADLQGQVVAWHKRLQEADEAYYAVGELNDALQQRVAQLEANRDKHIEQVDPRYWDVNELRANNRLKADHITELCDKLTTLQADHARVLGELNKHNTYIISCPWCCKQMEPNATLTMSHLIQCGDAKRAELQASLPAQPACTNHFSDGSKIFPSRECSCEPTQPARGGSKRIAHRFNYCPSRDVEC